MNTVTATRLHAADVNITMVSNTPQVTDYARRYFGPWWSTVEVPAESACAAPVVFADVDADRYATLQALVETCPHEETTYAKAATLVARDAEGTVTAVSPSQQLAYRHEPATGRLSVIGTSGEPVALAAARIARDAVRGMLLRDGWTLLHASAVTDNCRTVLTFGEKGAGKTTTALALANLGWQLLANDRIFVRPDEHGQLRVLPWPSAAAIGLGLLDALGWYDIARKRVGAGEALHPTQHQDVTAALLAGRREPLWEPSGKRERKVQVYPDQFADWFGLKLATSGLAQAVLFPQIRRDAAPAVEGCRRTLGDADFMHGATEDRYPDILGLAPAGGSGSSDARQSVAYHLDKLPQHTVVLGHDVAANAAFLHQLLSEQP
ncbi:hypothetical protein GTY20_09050 [Streptomyces sp. SID4946]|uniref:hypothetical protein n=1 Tax=Streptomyces sp. LamerLS-31b TaxID=1839765 RepID=UPI00081E79A0|nr:MULTISPECIES: hypothetical protein [unclassified Streptomyces]MYQ91464.1 hypothetical protein [Streptomyces sp. SID4946]SCF67708.1 hypothetical protein GA0115256_111314 [Streptomyces sp. DconLS]SCF79460.1 hypothetical protein GA0115258_112577 [Streptomyces sp. LamerLS-31b]